MTLPGKERATLELLVATGESYGLELVAASRGALKRGTVYVVLQRLAAKGLVASRWVPAADGESGPPRRRFHATALGARALRAHAALARLLPREAQCDFLSIYCPATAETSGFLNAKRIAMLADGAIVVNSARGPIVDDEALIDALKSRKLFAAGLDVYTGEPNINPKYRDLDNAFLLPHLGSATTDTRNAMGFKAVDNMDAFFAGKAPPDRVA